VEVAGALSAVAVCSNAAPSKTVVVPLRSGRLASNAMMTSAAHIDDLHATLGEEVFTKAWDQGDVSPG
jgi:hypothetical protein